VTNSGDNTCTTVPTQEWTCSLDPNLVLLAGKVTHKVVPGAIFIIVPALARSEKCSRLSLFRVPRTAPVSSVALGESGSVGLAGESQRKGREEAAMPNLVIVLWSYCGVDRGKIH
jgi:hypothetical protein